MTSPPDTLARAAEDDAVSVRARKDALPVYVNRIKVYPKAVGGIYRRLKWVVLILCLGLYYGVPWLRWDRGPDAAGQAILIDVSGGRAYFFDLEIWPQEVYFLAGLLALAAVALFLVSSLFGRLWCGYACPQTVWTDLFMAVERLIEGDRTARMRLDRQPWTPRKWALKTAKHAAWLGIAAATGGAWIFYYNDAPTTLLAILAGGASPQTYFFVGLFTATTYLLAGWAREQVCTYMCPWPRFQAAMSDENTLAVTYRAGRGEPRGKHKAGTSWENRGDCVDCGQCIAVCPTGIDIRDGSQLECIGCGLCIDACDGIMDKVGRPRRLIGFSSSAAQSGKTPSPAALLLRPRVLLYAAVLAIGGGVLGGALWLRATEAVSVIRDRAPLYVMLSDGAVRNGYTLKLANKTRGERRFGLAVSGIPAPTVGIVGGGAEDRRENPVLIVPADSVATFRVYVAAHLAEADASTPIVFRLTDRATGATVDHASVFLGPEERRR